MNESNGHRPPSQLDRLRASPQAPQLFGGRVTPQSPLTKAPARATEPAPTTLPARVEAPEPERSQALPVRPRHDDHQLVPLSLDTIKAVLDRMDARYFVDGDDAIGGIWDNGYFYFFLLEEDGSDPVFQVYGQWDRVLPAELYPQAAIFANEWNAERAWPKAYARMLDDDEPTVGIYGELTVDFGPTVTFDQLDRAVNAGIASSLALFDEVQLTFSDEAVDLQL